MCSTGKIVFTTKHNAVRSAQKIKASGGKRLFPYCCAECYMWHLTKSNRPKRRRRS